MKNVIYLLFLAAAIGGCDSGGNTAKQGPQTTSSPTQADARCEGMQGSARDDCMRQAREGGTATPSIQTSTDTPVSGAGGTVGTGGGTATGSGGGAAARAERGSGVEGGSSAGTTSGNQQPLSAGGTSR